MHIYVVVQFYPWFKFYFLLFLGIVMYDNEFETKVQIKFEIKIFILGSNKIWSKDIIEAKYIKLGLVKFMIKKILLTTEGGKLMGNFAIHIPGIKFRVLTPWKWHITCWPANLKSVLVWGFLCCLPHWIETKPRQLTMRKAD